MYVRIRPNRLILDTQMTHKPKKRIDFDIRLEHAQTLADIFEVVKEAVWLSETKSRGGLMLGLANLGNHPQGFLGAFFTMGSNMIVMNKIPLLRIKDTNPELYKPYAFHVLLHEYIHSLGYMDEDFVQHKVFEITKPLFGETHLATQIAEDATRFIPNLAYPHISWKPDNMYIELVEGFDRSSVSYIN
jgi:hypothetical protein